MPAHPKRAAGWNPCDRQAYPAARAGNGARGKAPKILKETSMDNQTNRTGKGKATLDRRTFVGLAATASVAALTGGLLSSCSSEATQPRAQKASGSEAAQPAATETPADAPAAKKALVAVFSWSGHTLQVADHIRELTGADFFSIEPAEPYTIDYNALLDIAQNEQDAAVRPALANAVPEWSSYNTVYLGYPVWWYHVPQIIKTFAEQHDLTGKTIIPFATSGGSSIEGTLADIRSLCPDVSLAQGLTLDGDTVASQMERVDTWLGELGPQ